jgi:iron complex transport system substrate-binding protein
MRIASLLPSATEIVYALGLGEALVGRSPECDHPPEAAAVPLIGRSVLDAARRESAEIDRIVRTNLHDGGSLYHLDEDRLREARPDLILTQGLCRVCAASVEEVAAAAATLVPSPKVLSLDPTTVDEVLDAIRFVGAATGREARARDVVAALRERMDRVRTAVADVDERPRVVCLEWLDPPFAAGHWVPEMVARAGGVEGLGRPGLPSRRVSWEDVVASAPEVVVLMPCGFDVARIEEEMERVIARPEWKDLPAVGRGEVYLVNASAYFNRPGPRIVDGIEILASLLHPDRFPTAFGPTDAKRWEA